LICHSISTVSGILTMRRFLVSLTALTALVAVSACSDQPQQTGNTSGYGNSSGMNQRGPGMGSGQNIMSESERLAQMQREFQTTVGDRVYFSTDSVSLNADAKQTLDRQATFLRRYPSVMLMIEGHADERGTREYNLALGDRRAQSTMDYLLALGIASNRLTTTTYGKERPEATGMGESVWSKNRRAVSVITQQ
jgi:peptidoglycan-associated lipoprotein